VANPSKDRDHHPFSFPAEFHQRLGCYVHLCGHIEGAAWRILVKHKNSENLALDHDLLKTRKGTQSLIKSLKDVAAGEENQWGERLSSLVCRVEKELDYRHLAIHGMWTKSEVDGRFDVEWFKNFGTNGDPDWRQWIQDFSLSDIEEGIDGAGKILSELLSLFAELPD